MIVSGIDKYIATWFDALRKAKKPLTIYFVPTTNCTGSVNIVRYYIHSVSVDNGTVTVTLVTDDIRALGKIGSLVFIEVYGQVRTCAPAYNVFTVDFPLVMYRLTVALST